MDELLDILGPIVDKIRALRYFKRTAELNSFSLAAKEFDVPASSISRRIKDLEAQLGVELIKRSTRHVSTTELGSVYYNNIVEVLSKLDEADELVSQAQGAFEGKLRISVMPEYGEIALLPVMQKFRKAYPDIILDLDYSYDLVDFAKDPVDIAIRGGGVSEERVIAKHLSRSGFKIVASPKMLEFLQRKFTKNSLSVVDIEACPIFQFKTQNGLISWWVYENDTWRKMNITPKLISNNGETLLQACLAHEGLGLFPEWMIKQYLLSGELVEVPTELPVSSASRPDMDMFILYPQAKYKIPKVKHCVDFIMGELSDN